MRKVTTLLCLVLVCCGVGKGIHGAKKGFSIRRVGGPVHSNLEIWDKEADLALQQPFRYLGRGRQCFAFASFDGKYVLKLPRTDIYRIPFWMRAFSIPLNRREVLRAAREGREQFFLNSMKIAFEDLRENTGVIAVCFGQTADRGKTISVIDPLGCCYRLPAHKTSFVLQNKQPILMKAFLDAFHSGSDALGKQILDAFIDVVIARANKGIWTKDGSFLRNYGFDGKKGYEIDIGSFCRRPDGPASVRHTMHPVRAFLAKTDLEMLGYFDSSLEKKMAIATQDY